MKVALVATLAGLVLPALAWASDCGNCCRRGACPPCQPECPRPTVEKIRCCEKVAVCCPVEKVKYRMVKTTTCVPKTKTKCVKDKCNPCAPPQVITYTEYKKKTECHWETYVVTEYKTRYVTRCTERPAPPKPCCDD